MNSVAPHNSLSTLAVVLERPEQLVVSRLDLSSPGEEDIVVDIDWCGISTGTEKLLWTGRMPPFPGIGYPLVPGYESVGRIVHAGARCGWEVGELVFVPGARCYGEVRGLFGGAAAKVVVPVRAWHRSRSSWERRACCWRWPPRPTMPWSLRIPAAGSDRRTRRARPADRAARRAHGRRTAGGLGSNRDRAGGAAGYAVLDPIPTRGATIGRSATSAATRRCSTR